MLLRQATMADLPQITKMVEGGRRFLATQSINQWQGIYPNTSVLVDDIQRQHTFVLVEESEILGSAALIPGIDPTYQDIVTGQWLTVDANYLAIHRVAVATGHHGEHISEQLIKQLFTEVDKIKLFESMRIDTHPQNKAMQYVIEKCGFSRVGSVNLAASGKPDTNNFAYEKLTSNIQQEHLHKLLTE